MQIYLVRHPQPANVIGFCYGRQDVAVDAGSVARAAAEVRARIPVQVLQRARIFSSPLSRCVLLARELAVPREPVIAEELSEMSFGSWEGQAWDSVPRDQLDAWARDVWQYRPGGAESAALVAERWQRWAARVGRCGAEPVVAVTHAGVIRVALALARAGTSADAGSLQAPVAFGSVHCVDVSPSPVTA
ncbi:MAG TPA: histidine phosphatase family protein [Steroidobacteraceae bacterium]|nr:histidine phosphatase family protein [Steroidobacteraceae bacterium]